MICLWSLALAPAVWIASGTPWRSTIKVCFVPGLRRSTGLGPVARGEGLIGLTRGFLYARAQRVLVSLWNVSDVTTRDLMVQFYGPLLAEVPPAEALRAAKLDLERNGPFHARRHITAEQFVNGEMEEADTISGSELRKVLEARYGDTYAR